MPCGHQRSKTMRDAARGVQPYIGVSTRGHNAGEETRRCARLYKWDDMCGCVWHFIWFFVGVLCPLSYR